MNSVAVTGIIVDSWRQETDRFIRLSVERNPDSQDGDNYSVQRNHDFITLRLPSNMFDGGPDAFGQGQVVEVIDHTQSHVRSAASQRPLRKARRPRFQTVWRQ